MKPVTGLRVLAARSLTLLQDDGRHGCHRLGLTTGGPLDRLSFEWANRLCGNRAGTPALEITLGGLKLEAQLATAVAITGALAPVRINGRIAEVWRSHQLAPGDVLEIGMATSGCRLYLAVAGGFEAKERFGSVATVVREGIGGFAGDGSPVAAGDVLRCAAVAPERCFPEPERCFALPAHLRPPCGGSARLHLIPCLEGRGPLRALLRPFFQREYRLGSHSDRMGCRLDGEPLPTPGTSLLSSGLRAGTVQLPPDGEPIVLMHDHQTIGGYPRLGVVASSDLRLLAQLRPGEAVRFAPVMPGGALALARRQWRRYERASPLCCPS